MPFGFPHHYFPRPHPRPDKPGKGISIIVPFKHDGGMRAENWKWLERYYSKHLPGAQIIVAGYNGPPPFNKAVAINKGCRKATGDIIVLMDADCYIHTDVIIQAAEDIRAALRRGQRLWLMPYRRLFRLTQATSRLILSTHPHSDYYFTSSPAPGQYENSGGGSLWGHMFGALIQVMPREAFELVGGMDPRFSHGWGGEDISFARALDTLYSRHKSLNRFVTHLWHPFVASDGKHWTSRHWKGQGKENNERLAISYYEAHGNAKKMKKLVDEGHGRGPDRKGKRK